MKAVRSSTVASAVINTLSTIEAEEDRRPASSMEEEAAPVSSNCVSDQVRHYCSNFSGLR